jgi:Uma2 family endonuclease
MGISTKYAHADLLVIPDDGKRREIVDGEMLVSPSPKLLHQIICGRIAAALFRYLAEHPIGLLLLAPLDVILSDLDVLEPDLIFVLNEHRSILQDWVQGAPDLVVEVLSPSTAANDRGPKLKAYARFGVPEYWIVDPDAYAIEVYRLSRQAYQLAQTFCEHETLSSILLPGFELPVADLFRSE